MHAPEVFPSCCIPVIPGGCRRVAVSLRAWKPHCRLNDANLGSCQDLNTDELQEQGTITAATLDHQQYESLFLVSTAVRLLRCRRDNNNTAIAICHGFMRLRQDTCCDVEAQEHEEGCQKSPIIDIFAASRFVFRRHEWSVEPVRS